jgi:hypothetical protein
MAGAGCSHGMLEPAASAGTAGAMRSQTAGGTIIPARMRQGRGVGSGHEGERRLEEVETAEFREFVEHGARRWRPTVCRS